MNHSLVKRCFLQSRTVYNNLFRFDRRFYSKELSSFAIRSHTCGELNADHTESEITLCGWLEFARKGYFITLRDSHGSTQVILPDQKLRDRISELPFESVVQIKGKVKMREQGQINSKMKTGDIEVVASEVKLLNKSKPILPIQFKVGESPTSAVRLTNRYLDLRSGRMQRNLRLRSDFIFKMREFLCEQHGFVDVETPSLFRRTPGGAREFVVPTHQKDAYYTLPQSPQQFKQLLMVGGIDRYINFDESFIMFRPSISF